MRTLEISDEFLKDFLDGCHLLSAKQKSVNIKKSGT
jgi:hypothetical protein